MFFEWGAIHIRWYAVMIACGFFAGLFIIERLAARFKIDKDHVVTAALIAFIGGIIGARLYFVALNWTTYIQRPEDIFATWQGGLSIHGGIIGGLIVGIAYARFVKLPIARCCDIFAVALPLGQAIGRWGNYFNSEAFGSPVSDDFPLRLFIPEQYRPMELLGHKFFHPTFLYESVWDLLLFGVLYFWVANKLKNYPGATFMVYLGGYSLGRLLIEPMRTDSIMAGTIPVPIIASAASLVLALVGLAIIVSKHKQAVAKAALNTTTNAIEPAAQNDGA